MSIERTHSAGGEGSTVRESASALELLADPPTRRVLGVVAGRGTICRPQLLELLAPLPPSTGRDRIRRLEHATVLRPLRFDRSGRATAWELTRAGKDLAVIDTYARRQIARLPAVRALPKRTRRRDTDRVLRALADVRTLLVALEVARPTQPSHLASEVGLSHQGLLKRLSPLTDDGVVRRVVMPTFPRTTEYVLTPQWRRLAGLVVLCARWDLSWAPHAKRRPPGDLRGLIEVIAPLAAPPASADGDYEFIDHNPASKRPRVRVAVAGGRLRLAAKPTAHPPRATLEGSPLDWCNTLIAGTQVGVRTVPANDLGAHQLLVTLTTTLFGELRARKGKDGQLVGNRADVSPCPAS